MKRILTLVCLAAICLVSFPAEINYKALRFYFPSLLNSPFGESEDIFVNGNDGKIRLEYVNGQMYNCREFDNYAAYSIPKGANIYLKLSNGEIITLTCEEYADIKSGLVQIRGGVYREYKNHSYFPLDEKTIELLRNFEIVKIRAELKKGVYDGSLKFSEDSKPNKPDFNSAYKYVIDQMQKDKNENSWQMELRDNPLKDF